MQAHSILCLQDALKYYIGFILHGLIGSDKYVLIYLDSAQKHREIEIQLCVGSIARKREGCV